MTMIIILLYTQEINHFQLILALIIPHLLHCCHCHLITCCHCVIVYALIASCHPYLPLPSMAGSYLLCLSSFIHSSRLPTLIVCHLLHHLSLLMYHSHRYGWLLFAVVYSPLPLPTLLCSAPSCPLYTAGSPVIAGGCDVKIYHVPMPWLFPITSQKPLGNCLCSFSSFFGFGGSHSGGREPCQSTRNAQGGWVNKLVGLAICHHHRHCHCHRDWCSWLLNGPWQYGNMDVSRCPARNKKKGHRPGKEDHGEDNTSGATAMSPKDGHAIDNDNVPVAGKELCRAMGWAREEVATIIFLLLLQYFLLIVPSQPQLAFAQYGCVRVNNNNCLGIRVRNTQEYIDTQKSTRKTQKCIDLSGQFVDGRTLIPQKWGGDGLLGHWWLHTRK